MQDYFLLYHLVSLFLGVTATVVLFILFLKMKNRLLATFLLSCLFNSLIVAALTYELYCGLVGAKPPLLTIAKDSVHFSCCALVFALPRAVYPPIERPWARVVEQAFGWSAGILALLMAVYYAFLSHTTLFDFIYVPIYAGLTLAILYFGLGTLLNKEKRQGSIKLRSYRLALKITCAAALLLLPAFLAVDFFLFLLPPIARLVPKGLSLLPAFYILMSGASIIGAVMEILEPEPARGLAAPSPDFIERYGLTKREAEILPLITRCMSYRQIGEELFISVGTVRTHLIHIYQKTGTGSRLELLQLLQREQRVD